MGGLPRRQTKLHEVASNSTTFVVDAGDLTGKSSALSESRLVQRRIKASVQFEAYAAGGIDAMVPGDWDLVLGVEWLTDAAEKFSLPYIAANLQCKDWTVKPGRLVERDGLRVAFIGVVGPGTFGPCEASSAVPAVAKAVRELGDADLHVLLSHQPIEHDLSIVDSVSEIDVVVNGHGRSQFEQPRALGMNAIQLAAGTQGKRLGVAQITVRDGAVGFEIEGAQAAAMERLKVLQQRVRRARERMEAEQDESARNRADQRHRRLMAEAAEVEQRLAVYASNEDAVQNLVANRLVDLSDDVEDDPVVLQMLNTAKEKIEAAKTVMQP